MYLKNLKEGDKVKYIGDKEYQKGTHKILDITEDLIILDNFYKNANP